jgi:outer membrane protein assembly factor BamD
MLRFRVFLCSFVALSFALSIARAELVWRPGEGWSDESAGGGAEAGSSRDQLEAAHKLEAAGQRDEALKSYKTLLRRWPLSFFAPEAQFRVAKILEDEASFDDAFKAFQRMVQKYPSSDFFEQALNEQYRIANLYLAGEPQRIWKIPVGPSMDKTVELYERVIKNAPYGTYAPQCQFNIGLAREQQRKYTDAIDAYQKVLDNYPSSAVAPNAQYQIGYAWMRSSISGDYDLGAAKKAIDAFQDYLVRYPNSDKAAQAQENIQKLGQKQTQGAFDVALFYEKQHTPEGSRAAFIYYNEVVREDPNSAQAQIAKKRIQQLRPMIEAMPGGLGPDGTGSLATQQPVADNSQSSSSSAPDSNSSSTPPSAPIPDPSANSPLPTDPNAPVTSSSPGATAAGDTSSTATPMQPSTSTSEPAPSTEPLPSTEPATPSSQPAAPVTQPTAPATESTAPAKDSNKP